MGVRLRPATKVLPLRQMIYRHLYQYKIARHELTLESIVFLRDKEFSVEIRFNSLLLG